MVQSFVLGISLLIESSNQATAEVENKLGKQFMVASCTGRKYQMLSFLVLLKRTIVLTDVHYTFVTL